jgi:hypothetical protein
MQRSVGHCLFFSALAEQCHRVAARAAGTLGGAYDDARPSWTVAEASGMRVDYPAGIFTVDLVKRHTTDAGRNW